MLSIDPDPHDQVRWLLQALGQWRGLCRAEETGTVRATPHQSGGCGHTPAPQDCLARVPSVLEEGGVSSGAWRGLLSTPQPQLLSTAAEST